MVSMNRPQQSHHMLSWFFAQGVSSVDIHLKCPKHSHAEYSRPEDWFWVTRHEALNYGKASRLMGWCRHMNANGSDIYIRPHRHEKQPMVFLDDLNIDKARIVVRNYRALAIQTSLDNTHVWLALSKALNEQDRKGVQQHIANHGFSDPASVSGEHLGRLCGFKSQKRKQWVLMLGDSKADKYVPPDISHPTSPPRGGACAKVINKERSPSEEDFSWVLGMARRGADKEGLIRKLAISAKDRGKPAPQSYAVRTVNNAFLLLT